MPAVPLTRRGSANQLCFLLVPFAAHSHNRSKLSVGGRGGGVGRQAQWNAGDSPTGAVQGQWQGRGVMPAPLASLWK